MDHEEGLRVIKDHTQKEYAGNWWYYEIKFNEDHFKGRVGVTTSMVPRSQVASVHLTGTSAEMRRALTVPRQ